MTFDGESDYLGEGVILVNFAARVEVSVDDEMGGPYYDEEGNIDSGRVVSVSGAVSLSLDAANLRQNPMKSSGKSLLKTADVSIDELDDVSLVPRQN